MVEAADLFNGSPYRRTVGGIAKSLGEPKASIVPLSGDTGELVDHRRLGHLVVPVPRQPRLGAAGAARASAGTSSTSSRRRSRRGTRTSRTRVGSFPRSRASSGAGTDGGGFDC